MHIVEQKAWEIINTAIQKQTFIDWEKLYALHDTDGVKIICVISTKGVTGKSTGGIKHIVKNITKVGWNFAWVRNTDAEKTDSRLFDSFSKAMYDAGLDPKEYYLNPAGIHRKFDPKDKYDKGLLLGAFPTLNNSYRSASQNSLACDFIFVDEVINPNFRKPHMGYDLYTLCKTWQRTKNALVVLNGNAHESDSDILNSLAIEFDWESGKTQVQYIERKKTLAIYVQDYKNKALKDADDDLDAAFQDCEEVQRFASGKVGYNTAWGVKNWFSYKVYETFVPKFMYDLIDVRNRQVIRYCVGIWNNTLYIKQMVSHTDFDNKFKDKNGKPYTPKALCYRPMDKLSDNIYIHDSKNYQTVRVMLEAYNQGNILFSTPYGRDKWRSDILPMLKIIISDEKRKILGI